MIENLAAMITKAASKQTYYTIRFLVDRERVDDAYRAYGYFRWVDDVLDLDAGTGNQRRAFLERQKALLESCYRGEFPRDVDLQENMLVELVQHDQEKNSALRQAQGSALRQAQDGVLRQAQDSGLQSYLRNMMLVMEFDAGRRGRVIAQAELNEYTRHLAVAVAEAMHYFIGHGDFAPRDETRYLAVSAAHILHMLRDTHEDVQAGYFNIPREVLDVNAIGPGDVHNDGYRAWVKSRVQVAREYFRVGKMYYGHVQNLRHRLAAIAYISRFEWLLDTFEREDYALRPQYDERKSLGTGLKMSWLTFSSLMSLSGAGALAQPFVSHPLSKS